MKKHQRILKNAEFSSIISKRKSFVCPAMIVYTAPKKEEHARVGISVGKKVGKAVARTRVKRQLRALIDSVFTFDESFDSIVIVRPAFLKMDYEQRHKMLSELHERARLKYERGSHEKIAS